MLEDDLEIRRETQVDRRGLEDLGHETVNRLDLEIGVLGQDPFDRLPRPPGQDFRGDVDLYPELADPRGVPEIGVLEPPQNPLLHFPGGVLGEGDGQDVLQVRSGNAASPIRGFKNKLQEPQRQGVRLARSGGRFEENVFGLRPAHAFRIIAFSESGKNPVIYISRRALA